MDIYFLFKPETMKKFWAMAIITALTIGTVIAFTVHAAETVQILH